MRRAFDRNAALLLDQASGHRCETPGPADSIGIPRLDFTSSLSGQYQLRWGSVCDVLWNTPSETRLSSTRLSHLHLVTCNPTPWAVVDARSRSGSKLVEEPEGPSEGNEREARLERQEGSFFGDWR